MTLEILAAVGFVASALIALGASPVAPTRRLAVLLGMSALVALGAPPLAIVFALTLTTAFVVDTWMIRTDPQVTRAAPHVMVRGRPSPLRIEGSAAGPLQIRQPAPPDFDIEPSEAHQHLDGTITGRRRGRHVLPAVATKVAGPLGLAAHYRSSGGDAELLVYPDVPAAHRLALRVRQGRFRDAGRRTRGPLGLGTDFESIRDYLPDDDVRQVNWRASQRMGHPMSNVFRVEQDREVVCVVDTGRLMGSPVGNGTRLDVATDAAVAVALVADAVGDRCGLVAFDSEIRRHLAPGRARGDGVVRAVFDLEHADVDSDYELAFHTVGRGKRALVLVLTDLLDQAAAASLLEAVPILVRRHAVVIASTRDPDIDSIVGMRPTRPADVYTAAAALHVLDARALVTARLTRLGADIIEAPAELLSAACVAAYLRAKQRARL